MIKALLDDRLDGWLSRLLPFLFRGPLSPNLLTVVGTLISLAAAVAFALGCFVAGGALMLAGGFFDLVDGAVARHRGIATRFGGFLDSTLDRLVDMALLLGLAMNFALQGEPGRVLLAGCALIASVLVSYAQARAQVSVPSFFGVGIFERGERFVLLAAGAILGFVVLALWIIAIGSAVTVVQRMAHAFREMERIDAAERASLEGNT